MKLHRPRERRQALLFLLAFVFNLGLPAPIMGADERVPDVLPAEEASSSPAPLEIAPDPPDEPSPAAATPAGSASDASYLVSFASGSSRSSQRSILDGVGARVTRAFPQLGVYAIDLPEGSSVVGELRALEAVKRVERDKVRALDGQPSDPAYDDQWSLPRIGWDDVYGSLEPSGTAVVALLDTGVDSSHPDLAGSVVGGTSMLDGSDGRTDVNGHGTALAGIIAATTDNGTGIAGVGYAGVRLMPVTVLDDDGLGQDSDIIAGIVWAVEHGADVINMSFSNPGFSPALQAAIDYAWDNDVVLVAAVGNEGSTEVTYPAGDRGVIGVSNTNRRDTLSGSSNSGPAVFLAAPGTEIVTLAAGGGLTSVSGTSASAAVVAAAAALLRAADSEASNGQIVHRLAANADAAGTVGETGNGRLNLARSIADSSTDSLRPAGALGGGPVVGPYAAALTCNSQLLGGVWNLSTTWSCGRVPTSADTVVITSGSPVTVTASTSTTSAPTALTVNASAVLTINSGFTLTIEGNVAVNGTITNAGVISQTGSLTFNSGATYRHAQNGGTIPTAAWSSTSTVEVTGWTSQATAPGGLGQSFGNFVWNSPGQTADLSFAGAMHSGAGSSVAGTLSVISTGSGSWRLLNGNAVRSLDVGHFSQSGGSFYVLGTPATGTQGWTLNVAGNFALSGGSFFISGATGGTNTAALNVGGNFSLLGGTITRASSGTATVNFAGTSAQAYNKSSGTISGNIAFAILGGATVDFGTSVLDGSSGSFSLDAGGTIGIGHPDGITATGAASGNIQVSGARTYSTAASYAYNGTGAQVSGGGLPSTVNNLTVAKTSGTLALSSGVDVGGDLTVSGGTLDLAAWTANHVSAGGTLTLGDGAALRIGAGSLPANYSTHSIGANSTVEYAGTTTVGTLNTGQSYGNLTISGPGVSTSASFAVTGSLSVSTSASLVASAGTITFSGTAWSIVNSGTLTFRGLTIAGTPASQPAASFSIAGALIVNASTTFAPAVGSTITFSGTAWSIVNSGTLTFRGLTIAGTPASQPAASFSIAGALTVNASTTFAPAVGSTITFSGTAWGIVNPGTLTFRGLTIAGTPASQPAASFAIAGALTVSASTTFGVGSTITFSGTAWSIVNPGALTFRGLTIAGTPASQPAGNFAINGALTVNASTTFAPGGTVTLNNGASVANSGTLSFQNLTVAASASVSSSGGNFAVAGSFTVNSAATYTPAAGQVIGGSGTLTGSGTVQVTLTAGSSDFNEQYTIASRVLTNLIVSYAGAGPQLVSVLTYGGLRMNNASGATLPENVTVNGTLTLTTGNIITGPNTLTVGGSVARTSGHIVGTLRKPVPTGSPSISFEVGDGVRYTPLNLSFASVSAAGTLSVSTTGSDHPELAGSTFIADRTANRHWTVTGAGTGFGSYSATFNFVAADLDAGARPTYFLVGHYDGSSWSYPTVSSVTATSAQATGLTDFGEFQLGEHVAAGDYRSAQSGNWATAGTWQRWNGASWVTAVAGPNSNDGMITVRSGHTVTVAAAATVDQVMVEAGGQVNISSGQTLTIANGPETDLIVAGTLRRTGTLTVASGASVTFADGGRYQHNVNSTVALPTATWNPTSTVEIVGFTTSTGGSFTSYNQAFGYFVWNSPGQTSTINLAGNLRNVAGDLTLMSTGSSGSLLLGTTTAGNLTVGGNYVQTGGVLRATSSVARTININGKFELANGTFDLATAGGNLAVNVAGDFHHTGGQLIRSGTSAASGIVFNGGGTQLYTSGGTISNAVNFAVNGGSTLQMAQPDTVISGDGSFTLSAGAGLGITSPDGITSSDASGNIQVSGTRTFSSGANYTYDGSGAQTTGDGLPATVGTLTINNAAGVTLSGDVTVSGTLALSAGVLSTGASFVRVGPAGSTLRTSGHVAGSLAKHVSNGAPSVSFEVGDASRYAPVTVTFANVSTSGDLSASTTAGEHPAIGSSGIHSGRNVNRHWKLTDSGIGFTSYDATFNFVPADLDAAANTAAFIAARYAGESWSLPATGTRTSTSTQATGLSAFGDFALGEALSLGIFTDARDIGGPAIAGSSDHSAGIYTLAGSGTDVWSTADQFQFMYRSLAGDGRITARVVSLDNTDPFAKAGVMIREGAATGARNAFLPLTPNSTNGVRFQARATTDGTSTTHAITSATAPRWVRLTRIGDTFTAEHSTNGSSWTQLGTTQTISMGSTVLIGLAVTSHTNSALNTVTFDNVSINQPPQAVANTYEVTSTSLSVAAPGVLANDSDPDGDQLTAVLVSNISQGSLTLNLDGSFNYTPNPGYTGPDSFSYRATDGIFNSNTVSVSLDVISGDLGMFTVKQDIGSPLLAGNSFHEAGTYTVRGAGTDIWGTSDQFHYIYRSLSGDGAITARVMSVQNTDPWAKAGVMIRESAAANSRHAMVVATPANGMAFQWRASTGGTSGGVNQTGLSAPYWVRLTRLGDSFTAYRSADGVNWVQLGSSQSITMASDVQVGLAVTSHNVNAVATATFESVQLHRPPQAVADSYSVAEGGMLQVSASAGVLANDAELDGLAFSVAAPRPASGPSNGSLTLNEDGSFSYTPHAGFAGTDSFTYSATNGTVTSVPAIVTVEVTTTAYVSASAWPTAFSSDRYLDLAFPPYVASGSAVTAATFRHTYRSVGPGDTVCYYFATYEGETLLATHGSAASPVSCNSTSAYQADVVSLPEVNSAARANSLGIRLYVRSSAGATSAHRLATLSVDSSLDQAQQPVLDTTLSGYSSPYGVAVNDATDRVYVTNSGANTVSIIDGTTQALVGTVPVGTNPYGLAVSRTRNRIYVANGGSNTVSVIDGATASVVATVAVGARPLGVTVNETLDVVYVTNENGNSVSVVSGATNAVTATFGTGGKPAMVAVNETTGRIYVTVSNWNAVLVVDAATNTFLNWVLVGTNPHGIAINPVTNRVYVANASSDSVSVISGSANSVVATIPTSSFPVGVSVNPTTNRIYVGDWTSKLSVIDGATNALATTVSVGSGPIGVARNAASGRIYVANFFDGTVSVVRE